MRIKLENKEFKVQVAKSDEEKAIGLSNSKQLEKGSGLAMIFDEAEIVPITMANMNFPIDIIFSLKGKVTKVVSANPGDEININKPSDIIVEVNLGEASDIKRGESISLVGEKNEDGTVEMADGGIQPVGSRYVLDENGKNQMNLKGGERIFSRISTKRMFELAKEKKYKTLGRYMYNEVKAQDNRPTEYADN